MRQKLVGVYHFGFEQVELYARDDTGGDVFVLPEKGRLPRMKIGMDYRHWNGVIATLFHEVMELAMDRANCRFRPTNNLNWSSDCYVFHLDHHQFTESCARAAEFTVACQDDLHRTWKSWRKTRK